MTKRGKPKHSRGASRGGSRRYKSFYSIGHEGILPKSDIDKGISGVGFAHKLHRSSDSLIDRLLLQALEIGPEDDPGYEVPQPRHVTSIPYLPIDNFGLSHLKLGIEIGRKIEKEHLRSRLEERCRDMDEKTEKPLDCEIGEIIEIGGRRVVAEVDNARVFKMRSAIRSLFESAGVAIPEMYPPHIVVAHADTFRDQHSIYAAATEAINGQVIRVEQVSAYTNTYTQLVRPEGIPLE